METKVDLQKQISEAMLAELQRQAEAQPQRLQVRAGDGRVTINGEVDLDQLVMVAVSSVAGGP